MELFWFFGVAYTHNVTWDSGSSAWMKNVLTWYECASPQRKWEQQCCTKLTPAEKCKTTNARFFCLSSTMICSVPLLSAAHYRCCSTRTSNQDEYFHKTNTIWTIFCHVHVCMCTRMENKSINHKWLSMLIDMLNYPRRKHCKEANVYSPYASDCDQWRDACVCFFQ